MITLGDLQTWSTRAVTPATAPEICFRLAGLSRWWLRETVATAANQLADDVFESLESAWAALTAGLITAVQGLNPRTDVWASAAWGPLGVSEVDGLKDKLTTAAEWGARKFFVPVWQVEAAQDIVAEMGKDLAICPLAMPFPPDAYQSLRGYLADFSSRPSPPASCDDELGFQRCRQYYLSQPGWKKTTSQFYESHLLGTILQRCRNLIAARHPEFHARHLVGIVSGSPELTVMAAVATGVTHCFLLHTTTFAANAQVCRDELVGKHGFGSEHVRLADIGSFPPAAEAIAQAVGDYAEAIAAEEIVVNGKPPWAIV